MQKHLITENTEPAIGTNIMETFKAKERFLNILSKTYCKKGCFVLNDTVGNIALPSNSCPTCTIVPNSVIIDKAKTKILGKEVSGELVHNIKCFCIIPDTQASNMCEFIGDSDCYIKTSDENDSEETADGLPIITLVRDYQIEGGVVREIPNTNGIKTGSGVTLGKLTAKEKTFYTIEPMWKGNEKWISCIPEGTYYLEWNSRSGSSYKDKSFDLLTEESKDRTLPNNRTDILIHAGNFVTNSEGCIILGYELKILNDKERGYYWLQRPTAEAINTLRSLIGDKAMLKITSGKTNEIKNNIN